MKAIIKIGKVEVKFEVPDPKTDTEPSTIVDQHNVAKHEFIREAKRLAVLLYKETKNNE